MSWQDWNSQQTRGLIGLILLAAMATGCTDPTGPSCRQPTEDLISVPEPTVQALHPLLSDLQLRSVPGLPSVADQVRLARSLDALGASLKAGDVRGGHQELQRATAAVIALHAVLGEDAGSVAELTAIAWALDALSRVLEPLAGHLSRGDLRSRCS